MNVTLTNIPEFTDFISAVIEELEEVSWQQIKGIVDNPKGRRQDSDSGKFNYIYVDQKQSGSCEDAYYGSIYIPLNNTNGTKFLEVSYEC